MQVTQAIQEARDVLQALETLQPEGKSTQAEIIEARNRLADLTAFRVACIHTEGKYTLHGVSDEVESFVHDLGLRYGDAVEIIRYTAHEEFVLHATLDEYLEFSIRDGMGLKHYGIQVFENFADAESWRKTMMSKP